jgi:Fe2+ or Zn2+ uptake regulation protein
MSCSKELAESLRARGFRMTPQRHAIIHILKVCGQHLSPSQVYEEARKTVPGITETTVYRTLEFLADTEVLQPALNDHRHLVYQIAGEEHHHILCSSCGAEVEIDHDLLEDLFHKLEDRSGYQMTTNHLTFFGLCPQCKAQLQ